MTGDVFEEDPCWPAFTDDAGDVWPEMARIVGPPRFPDRAEGLAGIAGEDGIECAEEGQGVEVAQVGPDGRRGEVIQRAGRR